MTFHCNDIEAVELFDFVATRQSGQSVMAYPENTTDHDRVGELCIDINKLKATSNQWLIEIEFNGIAINDDSMANGSLTILRVNYQVIDDLNATLETRILNRQLWHGHNIPNPMFKMTLFCMINLNDTLLTSAKWIILCHYSFHSYGAGPDSLYAQLRLVPLDPQTRDW